jgi:hypothetical protein
MNDNADVVQASAGALAGGAITGASIGSLAAANGGGGGPSISLGDIHVHVPEGTTDPQAFGRAVGAEIRTEIFAALEDLGFETGEPKAA